MSDIADNAQKVIDQQLAHNLQKQQQRTPKEINNNPYCEECGIEIHPKRRQLLPHVSTCIDCQSILEQLGRTK